MTALVSGACVTMALQSSTATALIAGGFVSRGYLPLSIALVVMLGANIGSSLVAQALVFDTGPLSTALIVGGFVAFRKGHGAARALGRVAIGLGLMLFALHLVVTGVEHLQSAGRASVDLSVIAGKPYLTLALAALLACVAHSSVAAILVICSLDRAGLMPIGSLLAMVLGANIGTALNPAFTFVRDADGFRLAIGNLTTRVIGSVMAYPLLPMIALSLKSNLTAYSAPALFNVGFNLFVAFLFVPVAGHLAALLIKLLPKASAGGETSAAYVQPDPVADPILAIERVVRETLAMVNVLDEMLSVARTALREQQRDSLRAMRRMDDTLDRMLEAIERYITTLDPARFDKDEETRLANALIFAVNLEHAGDVLERSLAPVAAKALKRTMVFEADQVARLDALFDRLASDLQLGASVFLTGDLHDARRLFANKDSVRELEQTLVNDHFDRLYAGSTYDDPSAVLDIARDLKRIEAYITAVARPYLIAGGLLQNSRLVICPTHLPSRG